MQNQTQSNSTETQTKKKRAFLVLGAESSGTRLLTRILINAGCIGDDTHSQRWDTGVPKEDLIVVRRSVPHNGSLPSIAEMIENLRRLDYEVKVLVINREWNSTIQSQVKNNHASSFQEALFNLQIAQPHIFNEIMKSKTPYLLFSFEAIVNRKHPYLKNMLKLLGLEYKETEIRQENNKYYE